MAEHLTTQRDIGRIEGKVEDLIKSVDKLNQHVDDIRETMAEARGGWRTLLLIGGLIATISSIAGGLVAKFAPFFRW